MSYEESPIITVKNLCKRYKVGNGVFKNKKIFTALDDISFEINKGEIFGIVGKNGSGKSTLLQLISGILKPTSGRVAVNGRIGALLELGAGFNPELSGIENIYINGAIIGLSKSEIKNALNDIINFADIGDFVNQKIGTYSSGMVVRLAFAIHAQTVPDVLIVDEALAVGDAKFQAKCFERIKKLKERGTTILLVSHSSEQIIAHCDRAMLLDNGKLLLIDKPKIIINRYLDLLFGVDNDNDVDEYTKVSHLSIDPSLDLYSTRVGYNPHEYRWGDKKATIIDFYIECDNVPNKVSVESGGNVRLLLSIVAHKKIENPVLGITIKNKEGLTVFGTNTELLGFDLNLDPVNKVHKFDIQISPNLVFGDYFISLGIASKFEEKLTPHDRRYDSIHIHVNSSHDFYGITRFYTKIKNT